VPENPVEKYYTGLIVPDWIDTLTLTGESSEEPQGCVPETAVETVVVEHEVEKTKLDEGIVAIETTEVEQVVNSYGDVEAIVETTTNEIVVEGQTS